MREYKQSYDSGSYSIQFHGDSDTPSSTIFLIPLNQRHVSFR